jgi:D-glycero-D-manno-heptose 1,7-bisphosphate phosphatase
MGIGDLNTRRAVFLDRDGVINRNVFNPGTFESPHDPRDLVVVPGAAASLQRLRDANFLLCLVSNQPDHALGKADLATLAAIHRQLETTLGTDGIAFDAVYYCYHHPRGITPGYSGPCECRKPSPYFLFTARSAFNIDLTHSWMVGDRATDIACGQAAGVKTIRVAADHPTTQEIPDITADHDAQNLADAVNIILRLGAKTSDE